VVDVAGSVSCSVADFGTRNFGNCCHHVIYFTLGRFAGVFF
jgi:hypothetical protein